MRGQGISATKLTCRRLFMFTPLLQQLTLLAQENATLSKYLSNVVTVGIEQ